MLEVCSTARCRWKELTVDGRHTLLVFALARRAFSPSLTAGRDIGVEVEAGASVAGRPVSSNEASAIRGKERSEREGGCKGGEGGSEGGGEGK